MVIVFFLWDIKSKLFRHSSKLYTYPICSTELFDDGISLPLASIYSLVDLQAPLAKQVSRRLSVFKGTVSMKRKPMKCARQWDKPRS